MKKITILLCILSISSFLIGQNQKIGAYKFKKCTKIESLPVSNQYKSGTCWSFGGLSFFESEMIRMGMPSFNLSEMYIVRHTYEMKAKRYLSMHGNFQFGPGGQFHDIIEVARKYGLMKESDYKGNPVHYGKPVHAELDAITKSMVDVAVDRPNKKLSESWWPAYKATLDAYLGKVDEQTGQKGLETLKETGLNLDDYIEFTSFSHLPFYQKEVLFIPDNWTMSGYYNVPLADLEAITNNALKKGFTIAWDTDVSNKGFSFKNGLAIVPEKPWALMSSTEKDTLFSSIIKEKEITQDYRQTLFDDFTTTDDHLMHIIGMCKDQNGSNFYFVKNSWGTERNSCGGFVYASASYFKLNTIAIMVHKDAVPKSIREKLGI